MTRVSAAGIGNTFARRLIGAAALNADAYEEVEADRSAVTQAVVVVILSSVAAGIGFGDGRIAGIVFFSIVALLGWAAWALLTYEIGVRLLPASQTVADVGQLLRTTGFATAPGLLRVFGVLPGATVPVFAGTAVWMLLAMIVAVRQALDYTDTRRAIAVCVLGWTLALACAMALGLLFEARVS